MTSVEKKLVQYRISWDNRMVTVTVKTTDGMLHNNHFLPEDYLDVLHRWLQSIETEPYYDGNVSSWTMVYSPI